MIPAVAVPYLLRLGAVAAVALGLWSWGYSVGKAGERRAWQRTEAARVYVELEQRRRDFAASDRLSVQHQQARALADDLARQTEALRHALSRPIPATGGPATVADVVVPAGAVRSLRDAADNSRAP